MTSVPPTTRPATAEEWEAAVDEFDPLEFAADDDFDPCLEGDELALAQLQRPYHRLHLWYTAVVLALIVTGLPIQFPDLRATIVGGYGSTIAAVHEWTGVAMTVIPVLAFALAPRRALETIRARTWRRDDFRFHAINLWFTLVSGAIFIVSGLLMWFPAAMPDLVLDVSAELHRAFACALYVALPLHLVSSRVRIIASVKGWWARVRGSGAEAGPRVTTEDPSC